MPKVKFHYADVRFNYNRKTELKAFIETLFRQEKRKLETLDYVFCSDEYLLQINQSHLNHDTYTDIITFELGELNGPTKGEIYISIDRIRDNTTKFNTLFSTELLRVIFHGALHLCGFKDKKKEDKATMRKKEDHYIELFK